MATATYEYAVRDKSGQLVKGTIDAENQGQVVQKLKTMGYAPISINETGTGMKRELHIPGFGPKVKLKDLAIMSRQFATMINSGLSLLRALTILAQQTESKLLASVLAEVRGDVETGQSLSSSLAKHPRIFPPIMINMCRAGEVGGFLDQVLLQIAENFEAEVKLRGKVKSAMTYPVVVFCMALLSVIGMLLFIVPIFANLFKDMGAELPAPTRALVSLSAFLKIAGPFILVGLIAGTVVGRRIKHQEKVRNVVDPWKLRAPVFGPLVQKLALSRFTRNLGTMLRSGVPILQALDIVADTSGNAVVAKAVRAVQMSVRQGDSLARPLEDHPVFPAMVVQMMAVGEDTGALDEMLIKISDFYDAEVEATTEALTSLIEPLMIAAIGGLIGAMIVALYMPIFSVFEVIK
ncbi:MAG: type II secretion system F family protein [Angustibacter sp.]